ncbi:MAG: AgmX/PglI C-terminal domain-containing protein [Myxococcota bacterium]
MTKITSYSPIWLVSALAIAAPVAAKKAQPSEMLALVKIGSTAPVQPTPTRRVAFDVLDALDMAAANALLGSGGLDPAIRAASKELRRNSSKAVATGKTRGHAGEHKSIAIALPAGKLPRFDLRQGIYNRAGIEPKAKQTNHRRKRRSYPRLSRSRTGAVDYVFGRAFSGVAECYGEPLRGDTVLRDTIITVVVVDPSGKVIDARILRSKLPADDELRSCIATVLTELHFPAGLGKRPVEIAYPWHFVIQ